MSRWRTSRGWDHDEMRQIRVPHSLLRYECFVRPFKKCLWFIGISYKLNTLSYSNQTTSKSYSTSFMSEPCQFFKEFIWSLKGTIEEEVNRRGPFIDTFEIQQIQLQRVFWAPQFCFSMSALSLGKRNWELFSRWRCYRSPPFKTMNRTQNRILQMKL